MRQLRRHRLPLRSSSPPARAPGPQAQGEAPLKWFKGNTHTHSLNSDGDSTPDDVVRWYREQRYHFLFFTDHNMVTPVEGLNGVFAMPERFLLIRGEEVTDQAAGKPVHLNMLGGEGVVQPQGGESVAGGAAAQCRGDHRRARRHLDQPSQLRMGDVGGRSGRRKGRAARRDPQRPLHGEQRRRRRAAERRGAVGQHAERRDQDLRRRERRHAPVETAVGEGLGEARAGMGRRPRRPRSRPSRSFRRWPPATSMRRRASSFRMSRRRRSG